MEALMVVALVCQVHFGGFILSRIDRYQAKCQKELITCYEKKLAEVPAPQANDPKIWFGRLKECVKERKVD